MRWNCSCRLFKMCPLKTILPLLHKYVTLVRAIPLKAYLIVLFVELLQPGAVYFALTEVYLPTSPRCAILPGLMQPLSWFLTQQQTPHSDNASKSHLTSCLFMCVGETRKASSQASYPGRTKAITHESRRRRGPSI